jgi:hypothetical protein
MLKGLIWFLVYVAAQVLYDLTEEWMNKEVDNMWKKHFTV